MAAFGDLFCSAQRVAKTWVTERPVVCHGPPTSTDFNQGFRNIETEATLSQYVQGLDLSSREPSEDLTSINFDPDM